MNIKPGTTLNRQIFFSWTSGIFVKLISAILSFFTIRIILLYLGNERYGLWITITSFVSLLGFMDLGFGNQLMNNIAKAQGADNLEKIHKQIVIACISLSIIIGTFLLLFLCTFYLIPWQSLLATPPNMVPDMTTTLLVVVLSFGITLLLNLISLIQRGLQLGYFANAWELGRVITSFVSLLIVTKLGLPMYWIAIAVFSIPLIFLVANWLWFFRRYRSFIPVNWKVTWPEIRSFSVQGSLFFYLQIAALIAYQTDSLILAHYMDYRAVSEYTVGMKLFSIPIILSDTYYASLWPAYANSYGRKDYAWIKKTFKRSVIIWSIVLLVSAIFLVFTAPYLVNIWLNGKQQISQLLLFTLGAYLFINAFNGNISCLLNALNIARPQVIIVAIVLLLNLALSLYLVTKIGVAGVLLGTILALVIGGLIPYFFLIKKIFSRFNRNGDPLVTN